MTVQDQDKFMLRLPDGMRDQLKADALTNERSMNAEIIARLSGTQANLRDQIAMAALPALAAKTECTLKVVAGAAYEIADAMLAAREVKP